MSLASSIIEIAKMYVSFDELERALWILDNPPAMLRDISEELFKFKLELLRKRYPSWTGNVNVDYFSEEAQPLSQMFFIWLIKKLETENIRAIIYPSTPWVGQGLRAFNIHPEPMKKDGIDILVSFNELQLVEEDKFFHQRFNCTYGYKYIWLSTYKYMSSYPPLPFEKKEVIQLRGYTPTEFNSFCFSKLPQYNWNFNNEGKYLIALGELKS